MLTPEPRDRVSSATLLRRADMELLKRGGLTGSMTLCYSVELVAAPVPASTLRVHLLNFCDSAAIRSLALRFRARVAALEAWRAISNRRADERFFARVRPPVRPESAKNSFCSFVKVRVSFFNARTPVTSPAIPTVIRRDLTG